MIVRMIVFQTRGPEKVLSSYSLNVKGRLDLKEEEMIMRSFLRYTRVCGNVIRINGLLGLTNEFFYLVIGQKAAAYVDTGYGFGDLIAFARRFTDLPLIVLNTHGHLDHAGGDFQFPRVYACKEDWAMLLESYDDRAMNEKARAALYDAGIWTEEDTVFAPPGAAPELLEICDGDVFDLGGVTLEAITMPGHSPGCVSFLYREARILFSGDNCGPQPLIMLPAQVEGRGKYSSCTLEVFSRSLHKLAAREGEFDRILNCHKAGELPMSCLHGVTDAVDGVLDGRYPGVPVAVMQGKITGVFSARGLDPEQVGKLPNSYIGDVVFARDNLR